MATARGWVSPSVLPGFGLTLGFAGLFLSFIVLIPMAALIIRAGSLPLDEFWRVATEPRALASYRLTFGASFLLLLVLKLTWGIRVAPDVETGGLDVHEHGMWGYPEFYIPVPGGYGTESHGHLGHAHALQPALSGATVHQTSSLPSTTG